jgi:ribose 1,5-bisphosphokinase PhnN
MIIATTINETIKASKTPIINASREILPHKMKLLIVVNIAVRISDKIIDIQRKCHGFFEVNLRK